MRPHATFVRLKSSRCNYRSGWSRKKSCNRNLAAANASPLESSSVHQSITTLPGLAQPAPYLILFFVGDLAVGNCNKTSCLCLGQLQKSPVTHQVGYTKVGNSRLPRAKEFARTAQLQIQLGELEAILGAHHGRQAF